VRRKHFGVRAYLNRRARDLEERRDGVRGTFIVTGCRIAFGWGDIPDAAWPEAHGDDGLDDAKPEPAGLDAIAAKARADVYQRLMTLDDVKRAIGSRFWPQAAFRVTTAWFHAVNGHISDSTDDAPFVSTHCVDLVGYDDRTELIKFFCPTWSRRWGVGGCGTMSYGYFASHVEEAWYFARGLGQPEQLVVEDEALNWHEWVRRTPLGYTIGIQAHHRLVGSRLGWAIARLTPQAVILEDLFVRPAYRRCGIGASMLASLIDRTAGETEVPFVAPINKIDAELSDDAIRSMAATFRLDIIPTWIKWAPRVALSQQLAGSVQVLRPLGVRTTT
jgi:GNAT superfamily N-acetyltransferase